MPTAIPAIKAKLGNTDYYILSMKAGELVRSVVIPSETNNWENLSVEERYQREINETRIKKQIAPYFACNETRFCGSIILTAHDLDESDCFEPLSSFKGMPKLYKKASDSMGFLTLSGSETLVALDGQHRLQAIRYAITGKDSQGKDIPNVDGPCISLAQEDITIILVAFKREKARQIFTHVNRYAKPTTAGQNIVTADDDIVAVLARKVADEHFGSRLVNYHNNTIRPKAVEFTTLACLYSCTEAIILSNFPEGKIEKSKLPEESKRRLYYDKVSQVWKQITRTISPISTGLKNPKDDIGDKKRAEIRRVNLLGKPVPQEILLQAYLRLTKPPTNMTGDEACQRLDALPWGLTAENIANYWSGILWSGGEKKGRIVYKHRLLASRFVAYLAGERLTPDRVSALKKAYLELFSEEDREGKKLPEPIK